MTEPQNILTGRVVDPPPLIDGHALGDLLRQHTSWAMVPASIPPVVTLVVWSLLICDAAVTAWLAGVQGGSLGCTGRLCEVATLSGHPLLTLSLAAGSLVSLIILACLTRAFTIGTARFLGALAVSSVGGGGRCGCGRAGPAGRAGDRRRSPADRPAAGPVSRHRRGISQRMSALRRTTVLIDRRGPMAMTVAGHDTAVHACRQTLTALQQQIQSAAPGLASRIGPCIDRPQLRLANDDCVWMLSPLKCDPLTRPGGRYVLPPSAVADLRRIAAAGIEFHTMVVGHEIGLNGPARQLIPQLRDGPRSCPPDLARALVGPVPAGPRAAQLARSMGRAITAVARPVTALARETAGRLDPVIFGLIGADRRLEPGAPALWVACTKWEW